MRACGPYLASCTLNTALHAAEHSSPRARSSVGQSSRLIIDWSPVQVRPGPPHEHQYELDWPVPLKEAITYLKHRPMNTPTIHELQKQLGQLNLLVEEAKQQEKQAKLRQIAEAVKEYGITETELLRAAGFIQVKRQRAPAMYYDPNSGNSWSGNFVLNSIIACGVFCCVTPPPVLFYRRQAVHLALVSEARSYRATYAVSPVAVDGNATRDPCQFPPPSNPTHFSRCNTRSAC